MPNPGQRSVANGRLFVRSAAVLLLLFSVPAWTAVPRFGRFQQTFTAAKEYSNPLQEVTANVEFEGPRNTRVEVPAFWDGGWTWEVRFCPEWSGDWRYRVVSSDPGLNGRFGTFRVTRWDGRRPMPLRLSSDRHYLVEADGKPWFWLGDTAWNGPLFSTPQEWDRYLSNRAAKKFTAIQFVLTQWRAGRHDEMGQVAFTGTDRIAINPSFFQRMDKRIDAVNRHGLVAAPVLLWALTSKERESPGVALPTDQAILLARYMVARYGANRVVWILGGDGDYRGANAEKWKTIGRAVFPPGIPHAPVGMHPRGMQDPWQEYREESWLDIFFYQSGHGSSVAKWRWNATQGTASGSKIEPARPVIDAEINYEGHLDYQEHKPITPYQVRRAAYYSLLAAPPAGVTYGAHGIWSWNRKPGVPLDHPNSGFAQPWYKCLDYPGARQMRVLHDIFDSIEWWKLRPDRSLLAEDTVGPEFRNYIMPARSSDGTFALIYLPANPVVKLNLSRFQGTVRGTWIDPRTGRRHPAGNWKPAGAVETQTPSGDDWLLLLTLHGNP